MVSAELHFAATFFLALLVGLAVPAGIAMIAIDQIRARRSPKRFRSYPRTSR